MSDYAVMRHDWVERENSLHALVARLRMLAEPTWLGATVRLRLINCAAVEATLSRDHGPACAG